MKLPNYLHSSHRQLLVQNITSSRLTSTILITFILISGQKLDELTQQCHLSYAKRRMVFPARAADLQYDVAAWLIQQVSHDYASMSFIRTMNE